MSEQRKQAAGPLADYAVGMRVQTKEGYPGTIEDIHERGWDLTSYYVTLDNGQGGGEYAEAEIWPLVEQTASAKAAVDHTAQDDYPELGTALLDHLPPEIKHTVAHLAAQRTGARTFAQPEDSSSEAQRRGQTCINCGEPIFYSVDMSKGSRWIHDSNWIATCPQQGKTANTTSHPIKPGIDLTIAYPSSGPHAGYAVVHQTGCNHTLRKTQYGDPSPSGSSDEFHPYEDDYFEVAPCARAGKHKTAAVPLTCADCGLTYYTDNMADPHHTDCQQVNGVIAAAAMECPVCHKDAATITGQDGNLRKHNRPTEIPGGVASSTCAGSGQQPVEKEVPQWIRDTFGKESFYLPMNTDKDQKFDNPDEQKGWEDGTKDGKAGITRNMQDPTNMAYRAGYDRGWAYGVEIYRAPAGGFDLGDFQTIEQMQTIDPPSDRLRMGWASLQEPGVGGAPDTHEHEGLPFFEAGELWDLVKGKNPDDDPLLQGYLTYNWCRYRKDFTCYYSKTLDVAASQQAGYAVWTPEKRGDCFRNAWAAQQACPIALPGPNVPGGFTDATVAWEQGGQHGGVPTNVVRQSSAEDNSYEVKGETNPTNGKTHYVITFPSGETRTVAKASDVSAAVDRYYSTKESAVEDTSRTAALDPSLAFMLTATWKEVQQKAKRIRSEGGVRIIASQDGIVTAHVKGDTNVYETEVVRSPGSGSNVASWTCGCKWAAYSWGRSGPWKKYEGRMCSHALALQYEAQARGMHGRTLTLDESQPEWMDTTVPIRTPNSYDRNKGRYSHRVATEQDDDAPLMYLATRTKSFPAKVWGKIVRLFIEDGEVKDAATGKEVPARSVLFPGYDPTAGLDYVDPDGVHTAAVYDKRCEVCGGEVLRASGLGKGPWVWVHAFPEDVEDNHEAVVHENHQGSTKTASPLDDAAKAKTLEEAAEDMLESAHDEERTMTPFLANLAAREGGKMAGLDWRFKPKDSLLRKMHAEANLYPTPGQCALNMSDTLRYTMTLPPEAYTKGTQDTLDALKARGYKTRIKNYWERGDPYNGVNVALTAPSGHPVEVQFHTMQSYVNKEVVNHPLYEKWRTSDDPNQRKGLAATMTQVADSAVVPPGVYSITPFKRYAATLTTEKAPRFLLVHDVEDAPLAVLRVDTDGDVARWEHGEWFEALEFGRFVYLGEPRSEEISEEEAGHYCDWLTLNDYAHAAHLEQPKEPPMSAEEWGVLADLHDVPEPALPSTDGGEDDDDRDLWERSDREDNAASYYQRVRPHQGSVDWLMGIDDSGADQAAMAVAAALAASQVATASADDLQTMAEATIASGGNPGDRDIMTAAQQGLEREALKDYSHSERQQIIAEGEDGTEAGNLDRLDLTGTHYEALEARRSTTAGATEGDDLGWDLLGDPNGDL